MQKYVCEPCGYVYDPEIGDPDNGIAPGTAFEDLPEDWVCPICGVGKDMVAVEEYFSPHTARPGNGLDILIGELCRGRAPFT